MLWLPLPLGEGIEGKKGTGLATRKCVETQIATPVSGEALDATILEAAQQAQCGTVVVGRTAFSWLQELWHAHLADTLLQQAKGCTLWVVQ